MFSMKPSRLCSHTTGADNVALVKSSYLTSCASVFISIGRGRRHLNLPNSEGPIENPVQPCILDTYYLEYSLPGVPVE